MTAMGMYPELPPFTLRKGDAGHQILWMDYSFQANELEDLSWFGAIYPVFMEMVWSTDEFPIGEAPRMHFSPELFWYFGMAFDRKYAGAGFATKTTHGPLLVGMTGDGAVIRFREEITTELDPKRYKFMGVEIFEHKPRFAAKPRELTYWDRQAWDYKRPLFKP